MRDPAHADADPIGGRSMSGDQAERRRMQSAIASVAKSTTASLPTLRIAGSLVHLASEADAIRTVRTAASRPAGRPLAVASINLDHVHHFRDFGGPAAGVEWLDLIDGAPIAAQARRMTGRTYPRLAGSDLIDGILDHADASGLSVGIVGGSPEVHDALIARFARDWPSIRFAGQWTPERDELSDEAAQARLAASIRAVGADVLLVCLGKPRQERWIQQYGQASGARVLLAFGAVVDFLAGRIDRAPAWISRAGFEWAWRLLLEPRRLAKRYLVQGPPAYLAVRRSSRRGPS
jgi:exopolysaccharide biosynthesis WecB/TagA/CpsF family protein